MAGNANASPTSVLLRRAGEHDPLAVAELMARYRERLRTMVRLRLDRRLRGRFASRTILQDVFDDCARRIDEYFANPSSSFFLWLRQRVGQYLQAIHRQHLGAAADAGQELSLYRGALPEVNSMSLAAQLVGDRPAHQAATRADMLLRLQDALNGMAPMEREVLALYHFEELNDEESAAVLGIDQPTAMLRYVRALKRLKEILNGIPGFFDH